MCNNITVVPISVVLFPCICSSALVIAALVIAALVIAALVIAALVIASLPVLTILVVVVTVGAGTSLQTAKNVVVYFMQLNDTAQIVTYQLQLLHWVQTFRHCFLQ